jgi:hypothetical protein
MLVARCATSPALSSAKASMVGDSCVRGRIGVRCNRQRSSAKFRLEVLFAKTRFVDFGICVDECGGGSLPGAG